jgi:uncharacterized protein
MSTFFYGKSAKDGKYYFRLKDNNNETILHSTQGYETNQGCLNGIASVKLNAPYDHNYDRFLGVNSQYYFRLKSSNGQIIGQSEGYVSSTGREKGIENCKREAPSASVKELYAYSS